MKRQKGKAAAGAQTTVLGQPAAGSQKIPAVLQAKTLLGT
jgi:hypothetical protein